MRKQRSRIVERGAQVRTDGYVHSKIIIRNKNWSIYDKNPLDVDAM